MNRIARAVASAVAVATLAGCALPVSGTPTRVAPSSVPYRLLEPRSTGAPAIPVGPTTQIYLVDGDHLVSTRRHVIGGNIAEAALRSLLQGPIADELSRGYRSAIPAGTRLISLDVNKRSVATVDLTDEFRSLGGTDQVLAVAQIVLTLTGFSRIDAVQFAVADRVVAVPDGRGSLDTAPHTRDDYRALASGS